MTSFYDWYADLPVASPQVFGDQTDVPESGDWWDATYLMMWGSNVPVTRTPDAHWMTEVRYRGTKVVTVSPDYADNTKFADEWLAAQAGTDAALAMAMGHVILKKFFLDRQVPFFTDYVKTYTDLPFLITLTNNVEHGGLVPGKFLTEVDLGSSAEAEPEAAWKTVLLDAASGKPVVPNGSMGFRYADSGAGRWNLDLEGITPALSIRDVDDDEVVEVLLPCFEAADGSGSVLRRGVPVLRIGDHVVTTVFDLLLAQYGVAGLICPESGRPATTIQQRRTASLAGRDHQRARPGLHPHCPGIRYQLRAIGRSLHDHHGCWDLPVVPWRRNLLVDLEHVDLDRLHGPKWRWLGALVARRSAGRSLDGFRWPMRWTGHAHRGP